MTKKAVVSVGADGRETGRWESMAALCNDYGKDKRWFKASCNNGSLYLGQRWVWAEEYDRMADDGRTKEFCYEPPTGRRLWRRRVAFTFDWRGPQDDELMFLFKGATRELLENAFGYLCGGSAGLAKGFEIREAHDVVRLWRHQYERLEVWLDGYNPAFASLKDTVALIDARLRATVRGEVDFYLIEDWMNLTDRDTAAADRAWRSIDGKGEQPAQAKKPVKRGKQAKETTINNMKEGEDMPKMYVRVPGYVAGFFRGRCDDRQLTEFDAYEFPDHDDLMLFMEHHLRFIPEQNQSVYCLSERAFNHILHGKQPGGGRQILNRDPTEWPSIKELCALTGKFVTGKQESADYLCIAIPKEILDGGRLHRTNGSYALQKKEAERFISYLKQEFKREFEAFCEVDEMNCLENGINRSDVDRMERFFANYNMPISVDQKDRESLRKLMFRIRKRKNIQPYLRRKLDPFVNHISEDDRIKAERWERKKERIKKKERNES